jgi:hypothetical protein
MEGRGVIFRLNTRLVDAGPGVVTLSDGEIQAETLVWTAGTAPNPLVQALTLDKDKRRALVVDRTYPGGSRPTGAMGPRRLCRSDRREDRKALSAYGPVRSP